MLDHVKFGVASDYAASKAFFLKALEPLGVAVLSEGPPTYGVELCPKGKASLCLYQTEEKPAHLHLAFTAENRQQVEAFSCCKSWALLEGSTFVEFSSARPLSRRPHRSVTFAMQASLKGVPGLTDGMSKGKVSCVLTHWRSSFTISEPSLTTSARTSWEQALTGKTERITSSCPVPT